MKTDKVLDILKIHRQTLHRYVKTGKIKYKVLPSGHYDYDEDSVYKLAGLTEERKTVIYGRVSTQKQKKDLENQITLITEFSNKNGYKISKVYKDIASGISFDRKDFKSMLDEIIVHKIKTVIIKDKDRLTRVSFDMWKSLFEQFDCELIVVNDIDKNESIEKEIFEDIISMLHCFSMRMYSSRRKKKSQLTSEDLKNEIE